MAQTTVKMSRALADRIREKRDSSPFKAASPGFVVSEALSLWAADLWVPGPDTDKWEGGGGERLFLRLDDDAFIAGLRKRQLTGVTTSPIMRRALEDWVEGRWEIGLVKVR